MNLKQLAQHLNLSQTTVSRALNGYPEVSEDTRRRVAAAARDFNYRPSPNATRLATGKSRTIGHVVPLSQHDMINPHFAEFIAGAGEAYAEADYDMLMSVVSDDREETIYRNLAVSRRVDGVIVHGPLVDDQRIELLTQLAIPFVVHGRSMQPEDTYSWLDVNNRRAFQRATEFLIDLGHRRIALINGLENMGFAARRRRGYLDALHNRGITVDENLMHSADMIEPYGHQVMTAMFDLDEPPTAVVAASVIPALGAVRAVQERGLHLGRDVSLIAYDDCLSFIEDNRDVPLLTSIRSSIRKAGKRAAELIINMIDQTDNRPVHEMWEAELILGRSTGPAPQRHGSDQTRPISSRSPSAG